MSGPPITAAAARRVNGRTRSRRSSRRVDASLIRRTPPSASPTTRRRSSIACSARSTMPKPSIASPAAAAINAMPGLALLELARGDASGAAATMRRRASLRPEAPAGTTAVAGRGRRHLLRIERHGRRAHRCRRPRQHCSRLWLGSARRDGSARHRRGAARRRRPDGRARAPARRRGCVAAPAHAVRSRADRGPHRPVVCRGSATATSAALEFDNAHDIFTELGARPDLDRVQSLDRAAGTAGRAATARSTVLRRCRPASVRCWRMWPPGKTNREIATELGDQPAHGAAGTSRTSSPSSE